MSEKFDDLFSLLDNPHSTLGRLYVLSVNEALDHPDNDRFGLAKILLSAAGFPIEKTPAAEAKCKAGTVKVVGGISLSIIVKLHDDQGVGPVVRNLVEQLIANATVPELDRLERTVSVAKSSAIRARSKTANADHFLQIIDFHRNALEKGTPQRHSDPFDGPKKSMLRR